MEEEEIYGTYSKIDKVFANIHFHTNCPHACADILNHSTSDHCPILIKLSNMGREMTKKKKKYLLDIIMDGMNAMVIM